MPIPLTKDTYSPHPPPPLLTNYNDFDSFDLQSSILGAMRDQIHNSAHAHAIKHGHICYNYFDSLTYKVAFEP